MATVHSPSPQQFALLPRPSPQLADAVVVLDDMDDGDSDGESVAESCPWPHQRGAAADDSCGRSTCCHGGEEEMDDDDDDGCSSYVEGDGCSSYRCQDEFQFQEAGGAEGGMNKQAAGSCGVWWERLAAVATAGGGGGTFPLPPVVRSQQEVKEEDPKRAAERREEDRKFWEDCLAS